MKIKNVLKKNLPPRIFYSLVRAKNFIIPTKEFKALDEQAKEGVSFYSNFIVKGDLVFDIGANYGNKTKLFLKLRARVVAVEPQENCVKFLRSMYGKKIDVVQKGVGDKNGTLDFFVSKSDTLSTFSKDWMDKMKNGRFQQHDWNKIIKIPVTTLDQLINEFGKPAFIKIDVEGFELEVLKGLSQSIKYLSFEYAVPENLQSVIDCINYLKKLGKCEFNYAQGENMRLKLPEWSEADSFLEDIHRDDFTGSNAGDIYVRFIR